MIHAEVNDQCAKLFGIRNGDFPKTELTEKEGGYQSNTKWILENLPTTLELEQILLKDILYPDQLVFLGGQIDFDIEKATSKKACVISTQNKTIQYSCSYTEAKVIEETICALLYIRNLHKKNNVVTKSMGEAGRAFIAAWESEQYRKSLVQK